ASPKSQKRAQVARMIVDFLAAHPLLWIEDEIEIVFQELVLGAPVASFPPLNHELLDRIATQRLNDPRLFGWVEQMGKCKKATVIEKKIFQDKLVPDGKESCFETADAFIKESIYPFLRATLEDGAARRSML